MVIDTEIKDTLENKKARKAMKAANAQAETNAMMLAGGGGTDFGKAYEAIVQKQRAEKFDSLIIVLTDGGVYLPANMVQELRSSIVVMPKEELDWFSKANPKFMAMVASPEYPAVKIVAIDFKTEE